MLFCTVRGGCPSADLNGDCFIDFKDFAILASQWLASNVIPEDMVEIPAGTFLMGDIFNEGSPDELPVHMVTLDSFYICKFEVTNGQYCAFLNSALGSKSIYVSSPNVYGAENNQMYCFMHSGSQINYSAGVFSVLTKSGRNMSNDPMICVTWYGAAAYCNWLSRQEGYEECYNLLTWTCDFNKKGYRLPTEAEWEYAARAGRYNPYNRFPWGDTISQTQANFFSSSFLSYDESPEKNIFHPLWNENVAPCTSPVGFFDGTMKYKADYQWFGSATSYQTTSGANDYGLYDMAGNASEWCNDWYGAYSSSPQTNPTGPTSGSDRVLRSGKWSEIASFCRVSSRGPYAPNNSYGYVGFRVVLDF